MSTIPVPLTTDVSPWLWFDAADPTMIRTNASNVLTAWYNKGTSGGLTNGTITGSPTVGAPINGFNTVTFPTGSYFDTPSLTPPAKDVAIFIVMSFPSTSVWGSGDYIQAIQGGLGHLSTYFRNNSGSLDMTTGFNSVANTVSENAGANISTLGTTAHLYTFLNSATTTANNYLGIDGSTRTINGYNATAANAYLTSSTYRLFFSGQMWAGGPYARGGTLAEMIVVRADITATRRFQIEGYLAWKWGLQANLPASHPFSVANKAATMALYGRPHGFTSVFLSGLTGVRGVICDSASNLYVAGGTGNYIRKYNAAGTQQWNITSVGGVACNAPEYVARDSTDNIYVSEGTGRRIIKITPAGVASVFKSGIDVGPIAVDSSGAVYYFNTGSAIMKITADGATTTTFATSTSGAFWKGLVCDANNNIFSSDGKVITKITPAGVMSTFAGVAGTAGATDGIGTDALFNNEGAATMNIDSRGYIYVAEDTFGRKVRMISPAGVVLTITGQAGTTTPGAASDNGMDINARYSACTSVAPAPDGSIYIADRTAGNIRKISPGVMNQVGTIAGPASGSATSGSGTGNALGSLFFNTTAISYLPDGTMFLADDGNSRVCKLTPAGIVSTFRNRRSTWIAIDNHNNIYTQFPGQAIYKNTPAGLETVFSSDTTTINGAYSMVFDSSNNAYVANTNAHRISIITPTGTISTFAGSGSQSSTDGTGTGASFNSPIYIARGPSGNYYTDELTAGGRIRKITPAGVVTTLATLSASETPIGIAVDSYENVYVSTRANSSTVGLIRMITPAGVVSTIAGGGSGTATDAVGTAATLNGAIYSISTDQYNNIFVADQSNHKFRMVARNAPPSGSVAITGTLTQGQTITADVSALTDVNGLGALSYAWSSSSTANGVYSAISGATSSTLTLTEAHVAKFIRVIVSYTDGRGSAESVSSTTVSSIVNVNDTAIGLDISGTLATGSTLTALTANIVDPDGNAPPYTYQWASSSNPSSGFTPIAGATASTYALTLSDVGKYIRLTVSYTNNYGAADSAVATTASAVINTNTPVSGTLSISGDTIEGYTLSANTSNISDVDGLGTFTYKWLSSTTSNGIFIQDASGSSTVLTSGQAGRYIKLEVTYVDGKGNSEYIASSVVGPVIAATPPSAPQDVSAAPVLLGATLSWSAPLSDGYSAIQGYRVYDGSGSLVVDISGFSYALTNLPSDVYTYSIKAYNAKGESSEATVSFTPVMPTVSQIVSGQIPETFSVPVLIAGTTTSAKKLTPVVSGSVGSVTYDPEPGVKAAVTIANIPAANVSKLVVATAAPQNGYTTLKIAAFNSSGEPVSTFTSPLSITLSIPGYTAASLLVRTYATIGGALTDTVIATQNPDGTYTLSLSHLTYLRVSQNIPCFVAGTKILTAAGYKAVEDIVNNELLATADGRALPCKVYTTEVDETTKENAPYVIPANTFAPRCPARELTLSPLHAIQLSRGVWQIPKMAATMYKGVRQVSIGSSCTYYHLEMPNYLTDNIVAEGTIVESYGARQLAGRRVEYKFSGEAGGFIRTITEAKRAPVKRA